MLNMDAFQSTVRSTSERIMQAITAMSDGAKALVFFGAGVVGLQRVMTDKVKTFATDAKTLFINEAYAAGLTIDEIIGVLCHEVMHVFMLHHIRRGSRDHRLWNIACDFPVNEYLLAVPGIVLPEGGLVPGKTKMEGVDTAAFAGRSAEQIYDMLLEAIHENEKKQPPRGRGEPCEDGEAGETGQGPLDKAEGMEGWKEAAQEAQRGEILDTEEPADIAEAETKARMAAAAARARGLLPGKLAGLVEEMTRPKASLYDKLERFIGRATKADYSMARPNKKYAPHGIYMPSPTFEGCGNIVVGLDTSGSVSNNELKKFLGVLAHVAEDCAASSITIIPCDAHVTDAAVKRYGEGDDIRTFAYGGRGGTDFKPVFDYVASHGIECDQMIFCTDLDAPFPPAPDYPVLWVSVRSGPKAPFGETVTI